jgi:hypothetical protein
MRIFFLSLFFSASVSAQLVGDPIADFMSLPIESHFSDASEIVRIDVVKLDLDGDGKDEQFVGHSQLWGGDNTGVYYAAFKPVRKMFRRLTSANIDFRLDRRFFGARRSTFCGYISERRTQGLLVLENDFVIRNPDAPGALLPEKLAHRRVYFIKNNRLAVDDLGPLDRSTSTGKAFYEHYFGKGVKSRPIKFEDYPVEKLKEMGYKIPDWKRPLPAGQ